MEKVEAGTRQQTVIEQIRDILNCLSKGIVVVLVGKSGSGKTSMLRSISPQLGSEDYVFEEIWTHRVTQFIQKRNYALKLGGRVVFTCQVESDATPYLKGLEPSEYKLFKMQDLKLDEDCFH